MEISEIIGKLVEISGYDWAISGNEWKLVEIIGKLVEITRNYWTSH